MDVKQMPDVERLVLDAFAHYMAADGVSYATEPQEGWAGKLPACILYRVDGSTLDDRLIEESVLSVSFLAATRLEASRLARKGQQSLAQAALDNFANADGVIVGFKTIKSPIKVFDGLTGKHANSSLFDATYRVIARAHY